MSETNNFLIRQHETDQPHYDLYLKIGEELKSWIVPNDFPFENKETKIAIENDVPEQPLPESTSEIFTEDEYGSGKSITRDKGIFSIETQWKTKIIFNAEGNLLNGTYLLYIPNWGRWTRKKLWTLEKIR